MAVINSKVALFWFVFLFSLSSYCVSPDGLISYYFEKDEHEFGVYCKLYNFGLNLHFNYAVNSCAASQYPSFPIEGKQY